MKTAEESSVSIIKKVILTGLGSLFFAGSLCLGEDPSGYKEGKEIEKSIRLIRSDTFSMLHGSLATLEKKFEDLKKEFKSFSEDLKCIPESEEFKKLEKKLDDLQDELRKGGNAARDKIEREVIPQLKEEIKRLKEKFLEQRQKEETRTIEI